MSAHGGANPGPSSGRVRIPCIASNWTRIIADPDHHLNDFCLFKDRQGTWHAAGIMGTGTWESERSLFHWSAPSLTGPYRRNAPLLADDPRPAGVAKGATAPPQKHAPFVLEKNGIYHLFYRRPAGSILHVRSADPYDWSGRREHVFTRSDARDVHIEKIADEYLMYYCQSEVVAGVSRSCILLRRSRDLDRWSSATIAFCDPRHEDKHSKLESPVLVPLDGRYYLFIRDRHQDEKTATVVLVSDRPDHFELTPAGWLAVLEDVHAPEIVKENGDYYIARVSGAAHANRRAPPSGGWIDLARLEFR